MNRPHAGAPVKVLLVVIDGASPRIVCPAIQTGRLPNLKRIADSGAMHERSTTIFPSIPPAATRTITKEGYGRFLEDFLLKLNGDRLRARTLFELVESSGRTASCVNYLVYRGNYRHKVHVPSMMALLPGVKSEEEIYGPSTLCLGD